MGNSCYLLAKYGMKEHLEELKNGKIFFNSIKNYRNDGTDYRGDSMEGKIPINPSTIAIYDKSGKNMFDYLPRPNTVTQILYNDDNFLMFCASAITKEIMEEKEKNRWILLEEYKKEMKQFGDYVLTFWSSEFLEKIKLAKKIHIPQFGYDVKDSSFGKIPAWKIKKYHFDDFIRILTNGTVVYSYLQKKLCD